MAVGEGLGWILEWYNNDLQIGNEIIINVVDRETVVELPSRIRQVTHNVVLLARMCLALLNEGHLLFIGKEADINIVRSFIHKRLTGGDERFTI